MPDDTDVLLDDSYLGDIFLDDMFLENELQEENLIYNQYKEISDGIKNEDCY